MTPIPKISKITRALQMSIARHMALCIPVGGKSRDPPSPPLYRRNQRVLLSSKKRK